MATTVASQQADASPIVDKEASTLPHAFVKDQRPLNALFGLINRPTAGVIFIEIDFEQIQNI